MLDFSRLKSNHHWSKKVFQEHGISIAAVARTLDLTLPHVYNMMNGNVRVTPENESKIKILVETKFHIFSNIPHLNRLHPLWGSRNQDNVGPVFSGNRFS